MATFCAIQHYGLNGTLTFVADGPGTGPVRSMSGISGLKWLSSGRSGSGKILSRYLQPGRKHDNMAGRSGIGVLVTGFSRVGALKNHAPLVFIVELCRSTAQSYWLIVTASCLNGVSGNWQGKHVVVQLHDTLFWKLYIQKMLTLKKNLIC